MFLESRLYLLTTEGQVCSVSFISVNSPAAVCALTEWDSSGRFQIDGNGDQTILKGDRGIYLANEVSIIRILLFGLNFDSCKLANCFIYKQKNQGFDLELKWGFCQGPLFSWGPCGPP